MGEGGRGSSGGREGVGGRPRPSPFVGDIQTGPAAQIHAHREEQGEETEQDERGVSNKTRADTENRYMIGLNRMHGCLTAKGRKRR